MSSLTKTDEQPKPTVDILHPSYQPSRAELREDLRVDATIEEAVGALLGPARVRYVNPPKRK